MIKPQINKKNNKTVFIGLSGGVDSAVSAYLLKKEGYKVVGAFIKTWQPEWLECTWKEERRDAMKVAAHLGIPFVTIDLENEYKKNVADYMISEYKLGITPNPDVMCNKEIKFGAFLNKAIEMGADFVATGHYARKVISDKWLVTSTNKKKTKSLTTSHYSLATGLDPSKDQAYFLWTLTQDQLSKIIFPIGNLEKSKVRKIAKQICLPNAEKKDSQGICFIGKVSMKDFLLHYIDAKKGDVLDKFGRVIGHHDGTVFFTIGERHGFVITEKTDHDKPLYVIQKNLSKNTITVGIEEDLKDESEKISKNVLTTSANWISEAPKENKKYTAQIRYHQKLQNVKVVNKDNKYEIVFEKPQTVASGQSIVIYDKEVCLGGGIII